MKDKCLYCYKPLSGKETDFHAKCSRKMFGTQTPPALPYAQDQIRAMAEEVIRSQTTLTGVQPKLSLDFDRMSRTPRLTIVGLWGRFILKPQTERYPFLPELEDLTMHLAQLAGVETVPHSLIRFADGQLCYITRRIDRTPQGDKIHMEDMCQLSERLTEDKYKGSHERIAKIIFQHSSTPQLDLVRYWEQVVFAWLTGNADMHLKNYSLYAPDGTNHVLTPAYDLLSTTLVLPDDPEELALTLCGKKRKLTRGHFADAMRSSGLSDKVCSNIFQRFVHAAAAWEAFICMSFLPAGMAEAYISLVRSRLAMLA